MKYLPRVDRAGALRRMGSVLTLDKVALRHARWRKSTFGQRQRKVTIVECSNSGFAHSSRSSCGGKLPGKKRQNERRKQEILRDQRTSSRRFW